MSLSELVHCEYCNEVFTDKGLTRHQQVKHPFEIQTRHKKQYTVFGRVKVDLEAETETFERIYPPETVYK